MENEAPARPMTMRSCVSHYRRPLTAPESSRDRIIAKSVLDAAKASPFAPLATTPQRCRCDISGERWDVFGLNRVCGAGRGDLGKASINICRRRFRSARYEGHFVYGIAAQTDRLRRTMSGRPTTLETGDDSSE